MYQIHLGLQAAFQIVQYCNSAIELWAPWRLAKDPKRRDALDAALYCLAELLRIVSILIFPVMPRAAGAIFEQLAIREEPRLSDTQWGLLPDGHLLGKPAPVFPRIETVGKMASSASGSKAKPSPAELPSYSAPEAGISWAVELRLGRGWWPYSAFGTSQIVWGLSLIFSTSEGSRSPGPISMQLLAIRERPLKRSASPQDYRTFARTMLELFWSPNLSQSVARRIADSRVWISIPVIRMTGRRQFIFVCTTRIPSG